MAKATAKSLIAKSDEDFAQAIRPVAAAIAAATRASE
jgi:hypothetical protein